MRTCYTGEVSKEYLGQTVNLFGWVHRRRDHGGVIFIDLRDREGLAQVVVNPDNVQAFEVAERIRNEYCLRITGRVQARGPLGQEERAVQLCRRPRRGMRRQPAQLLAEPFCRECLKAGNRVRATVVDHITPHKGDQALFWDVDNWQPLCKPCHDRWKQRLEWSGISIGCDSSGVPVVPGHHWRRG